MEKLKVIVVGAGMGGLTTAIAMQQAGYDVEIYDRVSALRPAGAGISLWSNGVKVLNRLGLGDAISTIGGPMEHMAYYEGKTGNLLTGFSLSPLVARVGQPPFPAPAPVFHQICLAAFAPNRVRQTKPFAATDQPPAVAPP